MTTDGTSPANADVPFLDDDARGEPDAGLVPLRELLDRLLRERAEMLDVVDVLMAAVKNLIAEQEDTQQELAQLHARVRLLESALGTPFDGDGAMGAGAEDQALREQCRQARRKARELCQHSRGLTGRASELIAQSEEIASQPDAPAFSDGRDGAEPADAPTQAGG